MVKAAEFRPQLFPEAEAARLRWRLGGFLARSTLRRRHARDRRTVPDVRHDKHDAGSSERQELATALRHASGGIWPGVGGGHLLFADGAQLIIARVTGDGAEAWLPGLAYGPLAGVGCSLLASPFGTRMEERVGVIGRRGIPT